MSRSRASARRAGTAFETAVARFLARELRDDRVERRARTGAKDRGDISGLRHMGERNRRRGQELRQTRPGALVGRSRGRTAEVDAAEAERLVIGVFQTLLRYSEEFFRGAAAALANTPDGLGDRRFAVDWSIAYRGYRGCSVGDR